MNASSSLRKWTKHYYFSQFKTTRNGSSYHFLPVATGLTSNVENLMTGEWLNFPEEAAPIPGPAVDV